MSRAGRRSPDRSPALRWGLRAVGAATVLLDAALLRRRGYGLGGRAIVRCRREHRFSTIWIPGASIKALRLTPWRIQRCPVGHHFDVVTLVDRSQLSPAQLAEAEAHRDWPIP